MFQHSLSVRVFAGHELVVISDPNISTK